MKFARTPGLKEVAELLHATPDKEKQTEAAEPYLQPGSSVINTTSVNAYTPNRTLPYTATKADTFGKICPEQVRFRMQIPLE